MIFDKVKLQLDSDTRFKYRGHGANLGIWSTSEMVKDDIEFYDFKKDVAHKGFGAVRIWVYEENQDGLNIKIEIYVPSWCDWDTMFEGYLETPEDLNTIIRLIGI